MLGAVVVGALGCAGADGTSGEQGPAGPQGPRGETGAAGASVAMTSLSAGDARCPYGGVAFAAGTATQVVCNGAPGSNAVAPAGAVMAFAGTTPPAGWLLCDGASLSRTEYAALFAAIGTAHGAPTSATFNLPDYRGRFLRGASGSSGRDPGAGNRESMAAGGVSGNLVGSVQDWGTGRPRGAAFSTSYGGTHSHAVSIRDGYPTTVQSGVPFWYGLTPINGNSSTFTTVYTYNQEGYHSHEIASGGDTETRPLNASVNFIIKT